MKTKHIIALVTFVATFVLSSTLVALLFPQPVTVARNVVVSRGCKTSTAQRISQLLRQDINNGVSRRDIESAERSRAARTEDYVSASERLSYEDLPTNFQTAWQKHIQAWRKQANLLNTLESDDLEDEAMERMSYRNTEEINRTWYEVLRIAKENGAVIPDGAY
jgi:hypothetical protein